MSELEQSIGAHPFMAGLKPRQISLLVRHAMVTEFSPGEVIFRTGDPANRFYCLISGSVDLWSRGEGSSRVKIDTLHGGQVLGWSWLIPPYTWAFDAVAREKTRAIFFYGTPLREECENDPAFGFELMKRIASTIAQRMQAARRMLEDVLQKGGSPK